MVAALTMEPFSVSFSMVSKLKEMLNKGTKPCLRENEVASPEGLTFKPKAGSYYRKLCTMSVLVREL